jgi:hypothetical protein
MSKIKEYKYIILILLIILGFAFYWYGWKPSDIKKGCYNLAREKAIEKAGRETGTGIKQTFFNKEDYDAYYKMCLQKNGL